ncbi:MAG: YidC/Oxa1 family membrane protein insertase [Patescibacteria group bacterium]
MIELFNTILVYPLTNILAVFIALYESVGLPGSLGLAIVSFTVFVRLLLYPMYKKQNETTQRINALRPHLDSLKEKHKNDNVKLQQEQLRLYQEAGVNPASGCILVLIQLPLFIALYQSLNMFVHSSGQAVDLESLNAVMYSDALKIQALDLSFLGFNLATTPAQGMSITMLYLLIPVVTGILQFFQASTALTAPPASAKDTSKKKGEEKKKDTAEDFQKAMQMQMKYIFPFMIAFISYNLPVALALYWNVFSIFSIIQYYITKSHEKKVSDISTEKKAEEGVVIKKPKKKKSKK